MGVDTKWLAKHFEEQEVRMTNEEVIERLRDWPFMGKAMATAAADRLEELIAERDAAWKRAAHAEKMWGETEVKLSESKALLAKAVRLIDDLIECGIWYGDTLKSFLSSRAELTGGKNG